MQLFPKVEKKKPRTSRSVKSPCIFPYQHLQCSDSCLPLQTSSILFMPEHDLHSEIASIQIFICILFEAISTHFSILLQAKHNRDIGMKVICIIRRITNSSTEQI